MLNKIWTNKFVRALIIILIIIFLHYITLLSPVEKLTSWILSPFQNLSYNLATKISAKIEDSKTRQELEAENLLFQEKINNLEQQIVELKIFIEEHGIVSEQTKYLEAQDFEFVSAKVIAKAIDSNPNLLLLNKGRRDGIRQGMAVVVEDGVVVGKIIRADDLTSHLLLLIDNSSSLSTVVAGETEIVGLVEGEHNISLILNYLLKSADIEEGDLIVTSGADNLIPAGLLVGEVDQILDEHSSLFKKAVIHSQVDFKNIRIVSVVLN